MKKVRPAIKEDAPIEGISPKAKVVSDVREVVRPALEFSSEEETENYLLQLWREGNYTQELFEIKQWPIPHDFSSSYRAIEAKKSGLIGLLSSNPSFAMGFAIKFVEHWTISNEILFSIDVKGAAKRCFESRLREKNAQDSTLKEFVEIFALDQLWVSSILTQITLPLLKNAGVVSVIELNRILPFSELMRGDPQLKEAATAVIAILSKHSETRSDAARLAEIFHLGTNG